MYWGWIREGALLWAGNHPRSVGSTTDCLSKRSDRSRSQTAVCKEWMAFKDLSRVRQRERRLWPGGMTGLGILIQWNSLHTSSISPLPHAHENLVLKFAYSSFSICLNYKIADVRGDRDVGERTWTSDTEDLGWKPGLCLWTVLIPRASFLTRKMGIIRNVELSNHNMGVTIF